MMLQARPFATTGDTVTDEANPDLICGKISQYSNCAKDHLSWSASNTVSSVMDADWRAFNCLNSDHNSDHLAVSSHDHPVVGLGHQCLSWFSVFSLSAFAFPSHPSQAKEKREGNGRAWRCDPSLDPAASRCAGSRQNSLWSLFLVNL